MNKIELISAITLYELAKARKLSKSLGEKTISNTACVDCECVELTYATLMDNNKEDK